MHSLMHSLLKAKSISVKKHGPVADKGSTKQERAHRADGGDAAIVNELRVVAADGQREVRRTYKKKLSN